MLKIFTSPAVAASTRHEMVLEVEEREFKVSRNVQEKIKALENQLFCGPGGKNSM
jgi:hypothetical protein